MGFILIAALTLIICGVGAFLSSVGMFDSRDGTRNRSLPTMIFAGVGALILVFSFLLSSYEGVDAGHVGVVRTFGEISGEVLEPGANWVMPWQTVQHQNVQTQRAKFRDLAKDEVVPDGTRIFNQINAGSLETQAVFIQASLTYHLDPQKVPQLFNDVGSNWLTTLLPDKVQQHVKAIVVRYPAVEVTQKREEIRQRINDALTTELSPRGILIESVEIVDISYSQEFEAEIERKQTATQRTLREQEQTEVEKALAAQNEAKAKGEAAREIAVATGNATSIKLRADAQAYANREVANSLTPMLVQYAALDKLDGVSIALVPADGTTLLDPTGILRAATKP